MKVATHQLIDEPKVQRICAHCGDDCGLHYPTEIFEGKMQAFCCQGCLTVYQLIHDGTFCNLEAIDDLPKNFKLLTGKYKDKFTWLDEPTIQAELLSYSNGSQAGVVLQLPSIHCSSCIYVLTQLNRFESSILSSSVNFPAKEITIHFRESTSLRKIVELLTSLGYEPDLSVNQSKKKSPFSETIVKIGVAAFCTSNIMLLAFPAYLGMEVAGDTLLSEVFSWAGIALLIPVIFYVAADYFKNAYIGLKQGTTPVDVPIALAISMLGLRTIYEIASGTGLGYADSLSGLVLLLILGKYVQERTFASLDFEKDYQSVFPLSVLKHTKQGLKPTLIKQIELKDIIQIRYNELVPADGIVLNDTTVDLSFISGESKPIAISKGTSIKAGSRVLSSATDIEINTLPSQSYLSQLWNKETKKVLETPLINTLFVKYFTLIVFAIAGICLYYWQNIDMQKGINASIAVLMVACPCALTLSLPFALSKAMAILGKHSFYVKNTAVIQHLATCDTMVFDKTGTLTHNPAESLKYVGEPLSNEESAILFNACSSSTHPVASLILANIPESKIHIPLLHFNELAGKGIEMEWHGGNMKLGSASFINQSTSSANTGTYIAINGAVKGCFVNTQELRIGMSEALQRLSKQYSLHLLTGDNASGLAALTKSKSYFNSIQAGKLPHEKEEYVRNLKNEDAKIVYFGDGINDIGAMKASNIAVAISEANGKLHPSSDVITSPNTLAHLADIMQFSKQVIKAVKISFIVSLFYNFIGISIAVSGHLSPLFAAIFMPLSSISVVLISVGLVHFYSRKLTLWQL